MEKQKKKIDYEKVIKWIIILTIVAIWGQSMIPREASQVESDTILKVINPFSDVEIGDVTSSLYWLMSDLLRKLAHLIEYGVLGCEIMVYRIIKKCKPAVKQEFINLLVTGMIVGLIDETIQVFSHRGSTVTDVWIDTVGFFLGLLFVRNLDSKTDFFKNILNRK